MAPASSVVVLDDSGPLLQLVNPGAARRLPGSSLMHLLLSIVCSLPRQQLCSSAVDLSALQERRFLLLLLCGSSSSCMCGLTDHGQCRLLHHQAVHDAELLPAHACDLHQRQGQTIAWGSAGVLYVAARAENAWSSIHSSWRTTSSQRATCAQTPTARLQRPLEGYSSL